jgi:hypothetical protein
MGKRYLNKLISFFNKNEVNYINYKMGDTGELSPEQMELIKSNRKILSENGIPVNKVRFVFTSTFQYDIANDIINPTYDMMIPINKYGMIRDDVPKIGINKPVKLIDIIAYTYYGEDNYEILSQMLSNSKRGVVVMIRKDKTANYCFGVDTYLFRAANLDEEVAKYEFK